MQTFRVYIKPIKSSTNNS